MRGYLIGVGRIPRLVKGNAECGLRRRLLRPPFETTPPPRPLSPFPWRCAEALPAREAGMAVCAPQATLGPRSEATADRDQCHLLGPRQQRRAPPIRHR